MVKKIRQRQKKVEAGKERSRSFCYRSGYVISAIDYGTHGIKVSMYLPGSELDEYVILLPPDVCQELGQWLLTGLGQIVNRVPLSLAGLLQGIIATKAGQSFKVTQHRKLTARISLATFIQFTNTAVQGRQENETGQDDQSVFMQE